MDDGRLTAGQPLQLRFQFPHPRRLCIALSLGLLPCGLLPHPRRTFLFTRRALALKRGDGLARGRVVQLKLAALSTQVQVQRRAVALQHAV